MLTTLVLALLTTGAHALSPQPGTVVQAGGVDLEVPGYSVPDVADWNEDGRPDLLVAEGNGSIPGKVRLYLNQGTREAPVFDGWSYIQADGQDLGVDGLGCMGAYPFVTHWDDDGAKDLLIGRSDGRMVLYRNLGTNAAPALDAGTFVRVGPPGAKVELDTGERATPQWVDWNEDGVRDLLSGGIDGHVRVYLNRGTDHAPDLDQERLVQGLDGELVVLPSHASPVVLDFDGDGNKDLLAGNLEGIIAIYRNIGTDAAPLFDDRMLLQADGETIDLPGLARTRPKLVDWNGDGDLDLISGSGDGRVHLWLGAPPSVDGDGDGFSADVDCDDAEPSIHPGMPEVCGDGIDNDCSETVDDCLTLSPPSPGYAGEHNAWTIDSAQPGSRVLLAGGQAQGVPLAVPGCPNLSLEIDSPRLVDFGTVDGTGTVVLGTTIPSVFEDKTLYFQAVDRHTCDISPLLPYRFR